MRSRRTKPTAAGGDLRQREGASMSPSSPAVCPPDATSRRTPTSSAGASSSRPTAEPAMRWPRPAPRRRSGRISMPRSPPPGKTGMDQDTFEGVVTSQIENPREIHPDNPRYDQVYMPANIVTGRDAEGRRGVCRERRRGPRNRSRRRWARRRRSSPSNAESCHTLEAAGSAGTDRPRARRRAAWPDRRGDHELDPDPEADIASGFPAGVMPVFDETRLPERT